MEKTIKVVNKIQKEGLIKKYAMGGGIATIFYVEPILTYDLDIFFIPSKKERTLTILSPIYKWLKEKGYKTYKEHIVIEGIPVQFIPVYNELIEDAVKEAVEIKYKNTKTLVIRAEHLIAIMLQTFRPKDKERIIKILDEAEINMNHLMEILQKYNLKERFEHFRGWYYGE